MLPKTVTGEQVVPGDGIALAHEHVSIDYGQMDGRARPASREFAAACSARLSRAAARGVELIVDCTPPGYGRDLDLLRQVSRESGVQIVAATGTFCEAWHHLPPWVRASTGRELADAFVAELKRGCGVVKVATSEQPTTRELAALDAAAIAHRETGVAIVCHTTGAFGTGVVERLTGGGVAASSILVSHVCAANEPFSEAVAIAQAGAYVGFDRIGHDAHDDEHWIAAIRAVCDAGNADRIVLAHDSVQRFAGPAEIAGHTFSDIEYIAREFVPKLVDSGFEQTTIDLLTRENAVHWLAADGGAQ